MSIQVQWHDESKRVVFISYRDSITWSDFHKSNKQAHQLIRTVPHNVHMLIHIQTDLPDGNPMSHFTRAFREQPANTGKVIIIPPETSSTIAKFIFGVASILQKFSPKAKNLYFVKDLTEAQKILAMLTWAQETHT